MDSAGEYAKRAVREVGRVRVGRVMQPDGTVCDVNQAVTVGVDHGKVTLKGDITFEGDGIADHIRHLLNAADAAAQYRGRPPGEAKERLRQRIADGLLPASARVAGEQPCREGREPLPSLTVASVDPGDAEAFGMVIDQLADPAQRMAIGPDGVVKPVSEFTAEEKWWCDGEDCGNYPVAGAPHVHVAGFETRRVDLLTGKDERHPEYGKRDDDGQ